MEFVSSKKTVGCMFGLVAEQLVTGIDENVFGDVKPSKDHTR